MRSRAWLVIAIAMAQDAAAQRPAAGAPAGVALARDADVTCVAGCLTTRRQAGQDVATVPSPWTVAASAIVPGLGQATQRVDRALGYLAVEAFAWAGYAWFATDSRRHRDGYRNLASQVARSPFSTFRPNGDFEYYERMSHFPESGRFDVVPGGEVNPETNPTTYNGAVWELARGTYWSNPGNPPDPDSEEWKRSIAFYESRAYVQTYRWSWSGSDREYADFKARINQSNDANRRSIQALTVVIANHVLSAVDAYIVVRLRGEASQSGLTVEGTIPFSSLARTRVPRIVTGGLGRSSSQQRSAAGPVLSRNVMSPP